MNLSENVQYFKGIGPKKAQALKKIGIEKVYDFLTYFPRDYEDCRNVTVLAELSEGEVATVFGKIVEVNEKRTQRGKNVLSVIITDGSALLKIVWFNQPFLKKKFAKGKRLFLKGKIEKDIIFSEMLLVQQVYEYEILEDNEELQLRIIPVYPTTAMLKQSIFRFLCKQVFTNDFQIEEIIPKNILEKYSLMSRRQAFCNIHMPLDENALKEAKRRLAFEELYLIQCGLLYVKKKQSFLQGGIRHFCDREMIRNLLHNLPFQLTDEQKKAWNEIREDMEKSTVMHRLLQGDVGTGKTVIALLALVKTVENGYQGALMAPTEILATQHYNTFKSLLKEMDISILLLTGKLSLSKRKEAYRLISEHKVDIVIGTHALIQDGVHFSSLGLVVTDEQHRFGIAQRAFLEGKAKTVPDVLIMTATPIPRTMTLTIYGDLDISKIEKPPKGRKPVQTFYRDKKSREKIYEFVIKEIRAGRQAYIVCPLIEENENRDVMSAEKLFESLKRTVFSDVDCALLHSKVIKVEKERIMNDFYLGKIKVLISTTVVEVGVDVPNATVMVVENANYFGLSQLHQLRGRVGRGAYKSYCILISDKQNTRAKERLLLMEKISDGFELAAEDLRLRGPGQFFGNMQHGIGDLKIANVFCDIDILLQAREAAQVTVVNEEIMRGIIETINHYYKSFSKILNS